MIFFLSSFPSILFLGKSLSQIKLISFSWLISFQLQLHKGRIPSVGSLRVWQNGNALVCTLPLVVSKKHSFQNVLLSNKDFSIALKLSSSRMPLRLKKTGSHLRSDLLSLGATVQYLYSLQKHNSSNYFLMQKSSQVRPSIFQWICCTKHWFLRLL